MVLPRHSFSKNFWALFRGPWCSRPPFSNSPPRATYPRIFSRLSTPIYAYGEAVEPNLQRHPYAKMVRHIQGWPTCGPYILQGPHTLKRLALSGHPTIFKVFTQALPTSNVTPSPLPPCPPYAKKTDQCWPHTTTQEENVITMFQVVVHHSVRCMW